MPTLVFNDNLEPAHADSVRRLHELEEAEAVREKQNERERNRLSSENSKLKRYTKPKKTPKGDKPTNEQLSKWEMEAKEVITSFDKTAMSDLILAYLSLCTVKKRTPWMEHFSMFFWTIKVLDVTPCQAVLNPTSDFTWFPKEKDYNPRWVFEDPQTFKIPRAPTIWGYFVVLINSVYEQMKTEYEEKRQDLMKRMSYGGGFLKDDEGNDTEVVIGQFEIPPMPDYVKILTVFKFARKVFHDLWWSHPRSNEQKYAQTKGNNFNDIIVKKMSEIFYHCKTKKETEEAKNLQMEEWLQEKRERDPQYCRHHGIPFTDYDAEDQEIGTGKESQPTSPASIASPENSREEASQLPVSPVDSEFNEGFKYCPPDGVASPVSTVGTQESPPASPVQSSPNTASPIQAAGTPGPFDSGFKPTLIENSRAKKSRGPLIMNVRGGGVVCDSVVHDNSVTTIAGNGKYKIKPPSAELVALVTKLINDDGEQDYQGRPKINYAELFKNEEIRDESFFKHLEDRACQNDPHLRKYLQSWKNWCDDYGKMERGDRGHDFYLAALIGINQCSLDDIWLYEKLGGEDGDMKRPSMQRDNDGTSFSKPGRDFKIMAREFMHVLNMVFINMKHMGISPDRFMWEAKLLGELGINYENLGEQDCQKRLFAMLTCLILSSATSDFQCMSTTVELDRHGLLSAEAMSTAKVKDIAKIIRPCGVHMVRARYLIDMAKKFMRDHDGRVPSHYETLMSIDGISRKTAILMLNEGFGFEAGIGCDVHVNEGTVALELFDLPEGKITIDANQVEMSLREWVQRPQYKAFNQCLGSMMQSLTQTFGTVSDEELPKLDEFMAAVGSCLHQTHHLQMFWYAVGRLRWHHAISHESYRREWQKQMNVPGNGMTETNEASE